MGILKIKVNSKKSQLVELKVNIPDLETDKIFIKSMSLNDLIISFDRLTRFKYPPFKKRRVYREILTKHVYFPKISSKKLQNFSKVIIDSLVAQVWNYSVKKINENVTENTLLNFYIAYEDIQTYSAQLLVKDTNLSLEPESSLLEKELCNYSRTYIQNEVYKPLNISGLLDILEKSEIELPLNIIRLIEINKYIKINENKPDLSLKSLKKIEIFAKKNNFLNGYGFPARLLILAEGATEEKLLPVFGDKQGLNFKKNGIHIIGAGGKNQVARIYYEFKDKYNIPVLILLDADAQAVAENINRVIKEKDRLYVIPNGEFEDILPIKLICSSINKFYKVIGNVTQEEIDQNDGSISAILNKIWKEKGFGEFKKAEFAKIIAENIQSKKDVSLTIQKIILLAKTLIEN